MKSLSSRKNKKGSNVSAIIANDNTITDSFEIAENFNNFFTLIGTNLKISIDYLKRPNSERFVIVPTTADEISDLNLKSSKCSIL